VARWLGVLLGWRLGFDLLSDVFVGHVFVPGRQPRSHHLALRGDLHGVGMCLSKANTRAPKDHEQAGLHHDVAEAEDAPDVPHDGRQHRDGTCVRVAKSKAPE